MLHTSERRKNDGGQIAVTPGKLETRNESRTIFLFGVITSFSKDFLSLKLTQFYRLALSQRARNCE